MSGKLHVCLMNDVHSLIQSEHLQAAWCIHEIALGKKEKVLFSVLHTLTSWNKHLLLCVLCSVYSK